MALLPIPLCMIFIIPLLYATKLWKYDRHTMDIICICVGKLPERIAICRTDKIHLISKSFYILIFCHASH